MAKETMAACATRHMINGVTDTEELIRLIGQDLDDVPSKRSVQSYRSHFRKHGPNWHEIQNARSNETNKKRYAEDPDAALEANRRWREANPDVAKESNKRWYAENTEAAKETRKQYRANNPARVLLNACKASARQRNHECNLTLEDVKLLLEPMICSVTGLALSWDAKGEGDKCRWLAPSIDRIDNNVGYVLGNVRVVCVAFNKMRSDIPDEVVMTVAKAIVGSIHH